MKMKQFKQLKRDSAGNIIDLVVIYKSLTAKQWAELSDHDYMIVEDLLASEYEGAY